VEAERRSAVKVRPSKSPTKYWAPEPPAMPPGLRLTTRTHLVSPVPSTVSGNRSGHSHTPATACAGPKSDSNVQSVRFGEEYTTTRRSTASTATITQRPSSPPCQKTFGSRNSPDPVSRTGLPAERVHVSPPSRL
jgi:hypothetical protein